MTPRCALNTQFGLSERWGLSLQELTGWKLSECAMISYLIELFHTVIESMLDTPCDIWDINPSKLYFLCWLSNMICVLSLSLYVFQFMYCYVVVPQNMLTNKIWIFFLFFLPTLTYFTLPPNSCLSFSVYFIPRHVKCSAVTNTFCTTGYDAVF